MLKNLPILVKNNDKWGIMNKKRKLTVPFVYDQRNYYGDDYGMFFLSKNKKSGSIDGEGNIQIPFIYDGSRGGYPTLKFITPNLIRAQLNGKYGIIDRENNVLVPFKYPGISTALLSKLRGGLIEITDRSYYREMVGYMDLSFHEYWEE